MGVPFSDPADAMLGTGAAIGQVCQTLEISEATFRRWCSRGNSSPTAAGSLSNLPRLPI